NERPAQTVVATIASAWQVSSDVALPRKAVKQPKETTMGPQLSAELSRLHQRDLLSQADHERLAAETISQPAGVLPPVSAATGPLPGAAPPGPATPAQPEWFEDLLQRYYRQLSAFVRGMLGSAQQGDDIVQEVFVAAWRAAQQGKAPFGAWLDEVGTRRWLFRVAYRRAISLRRHSSVLSWESLDALREAVAGTALRTTSTSFEERVVERAALTAALGCLSLSDAACVLLYFAQDCTLLELAGSFQISPQAAKQRIKRA